MTADSSTSPTLADLPAEMIEQLWSNSGVGIRVGPFDALIRVGLPEVQSELAKLYAHHPVVSAGQVFSFHLTLDSTRAFPRIYRRMVRLKVDGRRPHEDMPRAQALPIFEWGLNLVIALRCYRFLMLHAAVLERSGKALVLPAAPGHGKSTLCAALAFRGWRLFSDEFGLLRPGSRDMLPVPRPIALKNESIEIIRDFAPDAEFGPTTRNTRKGDVAHVKPPAESVRRQDEPAPARLIVFPQWQSGASLQVEPLAAAETFMHLASNAFNYDMLGERGFDAARDLVAGARCMRLRYGDLADAVEYLDAFAEGESELNE